MKLVVRPDARLDDNNKATGGVTALMDHGDMKLSLRATNDTFTGGDGMKGLTLRARKEGAFTFDYDVGEHAPKMMLMTGCKVNDNDVRLKIRHSLKPKPTTMMEASMDVGDDHRATVCYDLSNYDKPDIKRCALKWRWSRDDLSLEPGYDFGTESVFAEMRYKLDDENRLRARYDMHSNDAMLEWLNSSGMGGGGDLRVRANMNLDDMGKMPTLRAEKSWDVDW